MKQVPLVSQISTRPFCNLTPLKPEAFVTKEGFWGKRRRALGQTILPMQLQKIQETGRIENFLRAAGKSQAHFKGFYFNDSDLYKWLEAASWTMQFDPSPALSEKIDQAITVIEEAQQPDGYLNTYFMFEREKDRWTNLRDLHELYCAGHLFEAAAAHTHVTRSQRLLKIALKLAEHIRKTFNPQARFGTPGHPEIELALVSLAEASGVAEYIQTAQFLLDQRGKGLIGGSPYHQDHVPLCQMESFQGHAVRAMYLCSGATDIFQYSGDLSLKIALERLWEHMVNAQLYVSGGIGSRYQGEAFGNDYELPNERAYTETCAAIGNVMWNQRMLQIEGSARYADLLEWSLFNAVLPGISLDSKEYFYVNPLANDGNHRRQEWFDCACCPPNVARLFASLPKYLFSVSSEVISHSTPILQVWLHSYAQGTLTLPCQAHQQIKIEMITEYPWQNDVELEFRESIEQAFTLKLRIPTWCSSPEVWINGLTVDQNLLINGYLTLHRTWMRGDTIRMRLPMSVQRMQSHPNVLENEGRIALTQGPLLFCLEQEDNPGIDLRRVVIDPRSPINSRFDPNKLGGVTVLEFNAAVESLDPRWKNSLYQPYQKEVGQRENVPVLAIPYFAWANRSPGPMQVWIKTSASG
jgi:hypothetical protein